MSPAAGCIAIGSMRSLTLCMEESCPKARHALIDSITCVVAGCGDARAAVPPPWACHSPGHPRAEAAEEWVSMSAVPDLQPRGISFVKS